MDRVLLRDLRGRPKKYLTFQGVPSPPRARRKNHHIIVIDRSGSMCEDMGPMRETLVKLLAVEEFRSPDSLVSILSYSGAGDVLTHCTAVPVGQFQSRVLNTLMACGLTCMSGALEAAHDLASLSRDVQVTVTLHSDGYANDPSVASEARRCRELAKKLHGVAVLNTVAHRSNSDFKLLAELANFGGGACVQASGVKATYEALHLFQQAVVGDSALVTVPTNGAGALLFNRASGKVLLSRDSLAATLTDGDECYSLGWTDEAPKVGIGGQSLSSQRDKSEGLTVASRRLLVAYARGLIGMGQVTAAKEAALSSGFTALRPHLRALTGPEVAAFARKLEQMMDFAHVAETMSVVEEAPAAVTLPELLAAIGRHPRAMQVHLPSLMRHYKRRGLKRVAGRRLADGTIETPKYVTRANREGTADEGWVDVDSFDFNDAEATINMLTSQPVSLVRSVDEGGTRVPSVQGVNLEALREYRSFTIVGDGELCVDHLPCRVNSVKLHQELCGRDVCFVPSVPALNVQFNLDLDLPLTRDEAAEPSVEAVERMLRLTVTHKLLSAAKPEVPSTLASDQVIALREHHVTPALYYTPPTVSAYSDLKKAQADGLVDVRVSYRVTFGCRGVLHAGQLHSTSEVLKRRFAMPDGSEPTAVNVLTREAFPKPPEAIKRLKLGPVDELEMDVYRSAADMLSTSDELPLITRDLEHERAALRDIVFSVGASGAAPESWGPTLAAEDVEKLGYTVGKAERDGTFYHVGGVLVSIFAREVPYTI